MDYIFWFLVALIGITPKVLRELRIIPYIVLRYKRRHQQADNLSIGLTEMILLRKGGELAVLITPGFGASYYAKRDRVTTT